MKSLLTLIALGSILFAKTPPLSFIALEKGSWHVVVCDETNTCRTLQTEQEPRTYDYDFATGNLVYIASDKNVHLVIDNNETIFLKSDKSAYTEPSFIEHGKNVMLVELINGNSKKTKLISMNLKDKKQKTLHSQYSTALEPYTNNGIDLYYANVSCVEGCNKIIQEIWHKDLLSTEAEQLTLLNTLSHQPRSNKDNTVVYFSSNKKGNYHIWSYNRDTHTSKQLTFGEVTDGFPSPAHNGLYFLRRIENHTALMHLSKEENLIKVPLKQTYTKIRNLKVKQ
jgi:hypothetical protein